MYKRTWQSFHYLRRIGSYSTVPFRNGRVDVLPPSAVEGNSLEPLLSARDQLLVRINLLNRFDHWKRSLGKPVSENFKLAVLTYELESVDAELSQLRRRKAA